MANKLHELLAVEQERKNAASKALKEGVQTFSKKEALFDGMNKRYVAMEEHSEAIPDEVKELTYTVKGYLTDLLQEVQKGIDTHLSKEETNASGLAKADLVVEGHNFGTYSATSLLALEGHLTQLKELYRLIPVLDTARKWQLDTQLGHYAADTEVKFRSIKRPQVIVKYEATDKHPAQTELLHLDIQVGRYETVYTSGRMSLSQKTEVLRRLNALSEAVKVARSKANHAEVVKVDLAGRLFNFLHKDLL